MMTLLVLKALYKNFINQNICLLVSQYSTSENHPKIYEINFSKIVCPQQKNKYLYFEMHQCKENMSKSQRHFSPALCKFSLRENWNGWLFTKKARIESTTWLSAIQKQAEISLRASVWVYTISRCLTNG